MQEFINLILNQQKEYLKVTSKKDLDSNSQFFTPNDIAYKMVEELDLINIKDKHISILEPSAGFGILVAILISEIISNKNISTIDLTAFEIDTYVSKILKQNLENLKIILKKKYNIDLNYKVFNTNFITNFNDHWIKKSKVKKYNFIISNPPYKKINVSNDEAIIMKDIIHGQPNIYQLFIAMSLSLLEKNGQYVTLTPRNYLSGQYSKNLRRYIFNNFSLCAIHSFDNMNIFTEVDQEIIISTFINKKDNKKIKISSNGSFVLNTNINNVMNLNDSNSIIVPRSDAELKIYKQFLNFPNFIEDLGIKISVGPVVQFRNKGLLSKGLYDKDNAPLLISSDIQKNNSINYIDRKNTRSTHNKSINLKSKQLIKNSNYLILRKIASKKDDLLIIPAVLKKSFFKHDYLGLDNNLLYFSKTDNKLLNLNQCYGLYCFINTTNFEKYYSLVNGTFTINVNDFKHLKFPDIETIELLGKKIMSSKDYSRKKCDFLTNKYVFNN